MPIGTVHVQGLGCVHHPICLVILLPCLTGNRLLMQRVVRVRWCLRRQLLVV